MVANFNSSLPKNCECEVSQAAMSANVHDFKSEEGPQAQIYPQASAFGNWPWDRLSGGQKLKASKILRVKPWPLYTCPDKFAQSHHLVFVLLKKITSMVGHDKMHQWISMVSCAGGPN